jgi:hypothetical protein
MPGDASRGQPLPDSGAHVLGAHELGVCGISLLLHLQPNSCLHHIIRIESGCTAMMYKSMLSHVCQHKPYT